MRAPLLFLILLILSCTRDDSCDNPQALNTDESGDCIFADTSQSALYFKFTGTWCPPCGSHGAIKMKNTLATHDRAIGIEVHYNDEMKSDVGYKFISHFGINSFPSFVINNDNAFLIEHALGRNPVLGMHQSYKVRGNTISVSGMILSMEDLPAAEYYLAVYLLEDGYVAPQYADDHTAYPEWQFENGRYPDYIHRRILRAEFAGQTFGRLLHEGSFTQGAVMPFEAEMELPSEVQGDVYPVSVIWKRENREYRLVNAIRTR